MKKHFNLVRMLVQVTTKKNKRVRDRRETGLERTAEIEPRERTTYM